MPSHINVCLARSFIACLLESQASRQTIAKTNQAFQAAMFKQIATQSLQA